MRTGRRDAQVPLLGVGAIIIKDKAVLLIRRKYEPSRGLWSFPGGMVERGERVKAAVKREAQEETGLRIRVGPLVGVFEKIVRSSQRVRYHYVVLDYLAVPVSGRVRPRSDALDARWIKMSDLSSYKLSRGVLAMITRALSMLRLGICTHPVF